MNESELREEFESILIASFGDISSEDKVRVLYQEDGVGYVNPSVQNKWIGFLMASKIINQYEDTIEDLNDTVSGLYLSIKNSRENNEY